ncbi:hypothetical protein [Mesorhizobium salmacidum]|uniref:Cthe-2314-like HEPN domain-containing protein n=1 Tax=Mesorhizobium salmacidum TaxID=3015171 RepID=A0ABU8L326_9HYPH
MFVLNRTHARWAFKDLLGQANHFLITILVGLNGIRKNKIALDEEFRTSWNPKDSLRSAERSRVFALDLSLVRAIDALDTYFMLSVRKPCALPSCFVSAMDGTGRSVAKRLNVFDKHLPQLRESHKAALEVAIEWRNRRVHSLSDDRIDNAKRKTLLSDGTYFNENHSGLDVKELLSHFDSASSPTFKEAASIIKLCHEAVRIYDAKILDQLHVTRYVSDAVLMLLEQGGSDLGKPITRVWDSPKREAKTLRLLRLAGVSESESISGREVPSAFIERFVSLPTGEVEQFLRAEAANHHLSS